MRQFYEAWQQVPPRLLTALRVLPWSAHLHLLGRTKRPEECEFYLRMAAENRWTVRELERQIRAALFERAVLNPPKVSAALRQLQPQAESHFKDAYLLEFLGLPDVHAEPDLHRALVANLGRFLTELGRDFCYIGSEYPVQVGGQDFAVEYALSRTLAPTLIAEYQTRLPDKRLLQAKLHEFYALNAPAGEAGDAAVAVARKSKGRKA